MVALLANHKPYRLSVVCHGPCSSADLSLMKAHRRGLCGLGTGLDRLDWG